MIGDGDVVRALQTPNHSAVIGLCGHGPFAAFLADCGVPTVTVTAAIPRWWSVATAYRHHLVRPPAGRGMAAIEPDRVVGHLATLLVTTPILVTTARARIVPETGKATGHSDHPW